MPTTLSPTIYALPSPHIAVPICATVTTTPQGETTLTRTYVNNHHPDPSIQSPFYNENTLTNPLTSAETMLHYICVNINDEKHRVLWSFVSNVLPDECCDTIFAFNPDVKVTFPALPNVLNKVIDNSKWHKIFIMYNDTIMSIRKKNQDRVKITAVATFIAVIVGFIIHPLLVILPILCSFISPCIAWSTIIQPEMETFLKKCNDDVLKNTNVTIVFCARGNNYLNTSDHTDYSFLLIESTPL